jgi:hypothetical protein
VTVSAITSLTFAQASPARLADYLCWHWAIANGRDHVRDTTFAEDASQVRTGTGAKLMACLRDLAIGVLTPRRAGQPRRCPCHHARDPARPLTTLGIALG